jgi:hypothetical protein
VQGIPAIVSPTVKLSDQLRTNFEIESLPFVQFVEVNGESFIELHLTGLVINADLYKADASDRDYAFQCDKFCSGTGSAVANNNPEGLRIPNALNTKLDVIARIKFAPNSATKLPEVSFDPNNIAINVVEFSTFIDRIYGRSDLGCGGNETLQGRFACDEVEKFLYTRTMFMADIPETLATEAGAAVGGLLQSNIGGVDGSPFDNEKQLKFVLTSFGVNAAQKYLTFGVDVCDNGSNTAAGAAGGDCAASHGDEVRGIFELSICKTDDQWDADRGCFTP